MVGVERASDRQRPQPAPGRRVGRERSQLGHGAGRDDLAGPVHVGGCQPVGLDRGQHRVLVAAEHRGHAGLLGRGGRGHALRPDPDEAHRVLGGDHAGQHARRQLAHAVAGDAHGRAADRVRAGDHLVQRRRHSGGDQQRLGDGGVPDLVGVGRWCRT